MAVVYGFDKDSGNNAILTYNISSNIGLVLKDSVIWGSSQRPNVGQYSVKVIVTDGGSPKRNASMQFFVEFLSDTSDDVQFIKNDISFDIEENNQVNASIGNVSSNIEPTAKTLKFKTVQPSDYFALDVNTGIITAKVALDRETIVEHLLVVKAYDVNNDKVNALALVRYL